MQKLIILLILMVYNEVSCKTDCKNEPKCHMARTWGMMGADCYDKDFREFPHCLRTDVEIIDLTKNRIKQLHTSDLAKYNKLKMLYLGDNFLLKIDDDIFDDKTKLQTLDLSNNGMSKLPSKVFHLPSLQSFYFSQNLNVNIVEVVENSKPITSPLVKFDISFSEIDTLPDLGIIPTLLKYNISGNNLLRLNVGHFAGLCKLQVLVTDNITLSLDDPCDCWRVNWWLKEKRVKFLPFDCELRESLCKKTAINISDVEMFEKCSTLARTLEHKSVFMKYILPALAIILISLIVLWFYCRRKRKVDKNKIYRDPISEADSTAYIKNPINI